MVNFAVSCLFTTSDTAAALPGFHDLLADELSVGRVQINPNFDEREPAMEGEAPNLQMVNVSVLEDEIAPRPIRRGMSKAAGLSNEHLKILKILTLRTA